MIHYHFMFNYHFVHVFISKHYAEIINFIFYENNNS